MAGTATVTTRDVTLSHGKTRYLEQGSGHPVILLHGAAISGGADDFRPLLQQLGTGFRFLAPDFIGFPPSDTYAHVDAFPYLTDFIREFQDGLGIKSSHIVGCTMGGWIAGLFAYESPNRVDKLVLTGSPGLATAPNARHTNFELPSEEVVREAIEKVGGMLSQSERDQLVQQKLAKMREPGYGEAFATQTRTMGILENRQRFNLHRRLPHLTMPTLFLLGRHDPQSELAADLTAKVPGSKSHIIESGGHQIHYENTEEFAKVLLGFLA
jgi:pimeloyl-ACP methyl ester carboxylesterase